MHNNPANTHITAIARLTPLFLSGLIVACAAMKRSNPITTTVRMDAATDKPTEK